MKQYGKNWWIQKGKTEHFCCPWCGKEPEKVLIGKHITRGLVGVKPIKNLQVVYIECHHKEMNPNGKYNFPTKFRIEELMRFPREIGELKTDCSKP